MCGGFITGTYYQLINHNQLSLRTSCNAQMFQYREAILIGPVVEYFAQEEDGDLLLLNGLWVKEVMGFGFRVRLQPWDGGEKSTNLGASHGRIQARRACSSSKTVIHTPSGTYHRKSTNRGLYLFCIRHDGLTVLDNKTEMRLMGSERQ